MLYEHRVLTIAQLAALAFDSVSAAQHRLVLLTRYRLVDRFRPFRPTGSAPFHYVLDRGAALVAEELGLDPKQVWSSPVPHELDSLRRLRAQIEADPDAWPW